ncbi:hypothetical protein ACQZV8_00965 [Magnetococcales bacterium HHB-1]
MIKQQTHLQKLFSNKNRALKLTLPLLLVLLLALHAYQQRTPTDLLARCLHDKKACIGKTLDIEGTVLQVHPPKMVLENRGRTLTIHGISSEIQPQNRLRVLIYFGPNYQLILKKVARLNPITTIKYTISILGLFIGLWLLYTHFKPTRTGLIQRQL